jgi:hypothetical protein
MGICGSMITSEKNIDNENDIDKIILILNAFMKDKLTKDQIKPFLSNLLYYQTLSEKNDLVKSRRFFKWIEMSSILKTFSYYNDITTITNSLKKFQEKDEEKNDIKYDIFFKKGTKEISYTEQGLKQFYSKNKAKFESRMLKSPPSAFRWCAWIIRTCAQSQRTIIFYEKIINMKIKKKTHIEILNVIEDTIKEKCEKSNLIKSCLFRLLKSIIILAPDIYYLKEISYILTFLIVISNFDEVNIFYLITSLLSFDENNKYCLRGFYTKEKPLAKICIKIFEKNFEDLFPDLKEHFKLINFEYNTFIDSWIRICFVNIFPNILVLRIWDYFLVNGISFFISLSLSIMENFYEDLMNLSSKQEILNFINGLNPDKYSLYPKIIFNIEEIIYNAEKNFKITNEEIFSELKNDYPNYDIEFKYKFENFNEQNIKSSHDNESKDSIDERLSTIDRFGSIHSLSSSNNNNCYTHLNSLIKKGFSDLEENLNENIELSISQKNRFGETNFSFENSFEEIEDESNYHLHEHIKDLINKQEDANLNSNYIK